MSKIGIHRQGGEGNSGTSPPIEKKQVSRNKFFCFTYFFKDDNDILEFENRLKIICLKYMFGREICPTTGNKHLQGFMELKKASRITELTVLKCHLEKCKGSEEDNEKYCSKDNIVTKFGYPKPIKIIENLYDWQLKIETLCLSEPDGRTINWYWDTKGNVGKSSFCKYMFVKHGALVIQGGKLADIMNIIFNANMDNINAVIIDVPRANRNNVSYNSIECILNGMITNTKYETGAKVFNPPHVVVFCNYEPELNDDKTSKDRWRITELKKNI